MGGSALDDVPDIPSAESLRPWMEALLPATGAARYEEDIRRTFEGYASPDVADFDALIGPYGSAAWRRFAHAILLADWACYTKPADRVEFHRSLWVTAAFPAGFRVFMCRLPDGRHVPVGYTGWYPISRNVFQLLHSDPLTITHRGLIAPLQRLDTGGNFIYLYNYSIISALRKTDQSRILVSELAATLSSLKILGMAAVTVSDDGERVARRFGLNYSGDMFHEGDRERVFTAELPVPA